MWSMSRYDWVSACLNVVVAGVRCAGSLGENVKRSIWMSCTMNG